LAAGSELDGEGGYTAFGKAVSAATSLKLGCLPLGLSQGARLNRDTAAGEIIRYEDVTLDLNHEAGIMRKSMEKQNQT